MKTRASLITWTCIGLSAVALAIALLPRSKAKATPPREVRSSDLVVRNGRSYYKNETVPFSGTMVEKYPDGALRSRSALVDGRLEGVSEGWYASGTIQVREHFVAGVSHGIREKWYTNGNKLSEGTIDHGKFEGLFRRWHENGVLAESAEMHDGQPNGWATSFYPSASIKTRAKLANGQVLSQEHWKDGERREIN